MAQSTFTNSPLQQPLELACGITIPNRIAKSAMSEQLADRHGSPTTDLQQLYAAWARGGAGLLITGNVMIDHRAFVEPRNVVLQDEQFYKLISYGLRLLRPMAAKSSCKLTIRVVLLSCHF